MVTDPQEASGPPSSAWRMRLLLVQLVEAPLWPSAVLLLATALLCHLHLVILMVGAPLAVATELWLHRQRPRLAVRLERWARRHGDAAEAWHDRTWDRVFALEEQLNGPRARPAKVALAVAVATLVYHCLAHHGRVGTEAGWADDGGLVLSPATIGKPLAKGGVDLRHS